MKTTVLPLAGGGSVKGMARRLGWLSLGLGVTELVAPRALRPPSCRDTAAAGPGVISGTISDESQASYSSSRRIAGMRSWISAATTLGVVVMIVQLVTPSRSLRSHRPAKAKGRKSASTKR